METGGSSHVNQPNIGLVYNTKITYIRDNPHGAIVYKDPHNQFLIKIKDHPAKFEATPFVNYQGDLYIGQQGEIYIVVENPDIVDNLGGIQKPKPHEGDEVPPKPIQEGVKFVNSILVCQVCIDDPTKALYKRMDEGSKFFYERYNPLNHSLFEVKILYVFQQEGFMSEPQPVAFVDKYAQEWILVLREEVKDYTYKGIPIFWLGK